MEMAIVFRILTILSKTQYQMRIMGPGLMFSTENLQLEGGAGP